jgi:hypothetical protein
MNQLQSSFKSILPKVTVILVAFVLSLSVGTAGERLWDRSRVRPDNVALQFVPADAAETDRRLDEIREHLPRDRNQKPTIDPLSDANFRDALGRLLDFYSLGLVYYLEGERGDTASPFGLARQKPVDVYQTEHRDFVELMVAWGIHPPGGEIGGIVSILERLHDERALPILARLYFFDANDKLEGGDLVRARPAGNVHQPILLLTTNRKPELLSSLPRRDHRMWNKNFYDETRKWILANREFLLPNGVPKFANVQEAPFLDYIAKQEAALLAAPLEGANNESANERRDKMVAVWIGVGALLLLLLAWTIRNLRRKQQPT